MSTTHYLKTSFQNPSIENIENLIKYFKNIGGKELSLKCRRQNAFKTSWNDSEKKLLARCHIQNASAYLEYLKTNYSDYQIKTTIADIAKYIKLFDSKEDTGFILLSTNIIPSTIQFDNASRLFYNHQIRNQYQNNYSCDLLVLYAIRLSLESRIKGMLGIDIVKKKNGSPIGLSTLIDIAKSLKSIEYSNKFDWEEIIWINKWINHYMHRHLRPYPWEIHQVAISE